MEDEISYTLLSPPFWSQLESSRLNDRLQALDEVTKSILATIEPSREEDGNREWRVFLWQSLLSAFIRPRYLEGRWRAGLQDSITSISKRAVDLEDLRADLCSSLRELVPFNSPESQVISFVTIGFSNFYSPGQALRLI